MTSTFPPSLSLFNNLSKVLNYILVPTINFRTLGFNFLFSILFGNSWYSLFPSLTLLLDLSIIFCPVDSLGVSLSRKLFTSFICFANVPPFSEWVFGDVSFLNTPDSLVFLFLGFPDLVRPFCSTICAFSLIT